MSKKKPLLEALKRIGGKLSLNEAYRDPDQNAELVLHWMTTKKLNDRERAYIAKELIGQMKAWDELDEVVEQILDDLGGSAIPGKYLPDDMAMDIDTDSESDYEKFYMKGLNPDGTPYDENLDLNEKQEASWTWTELSNAFWDMGMDTRKISTMRQKLKKYTKK
jgi:hypothetical protein